MKKGGRYADFFDPYKDLMLETEIFCHHRDAKDWFYFSYGMTIKEALVGVKDKLTELELMRGGLTEYADSVLQQLEGYEEYEWCDKVKKQTRKMYHEIFALQMRLENLDK